MKDKPSATNRPNMPVSPKKKPKQSFSISVDVDTNKMQLKLRAIAKHTAALADELDAIDNAWQCSECGSNSYTTLFDGTNIVMCTCDGCGKHLTNDDLPTNLEGTD